MQGWNPFCKDFTRKHKESSMPGTAKRKWNVTKGTEGASAGATMIHWWQQGAKNQRIYRKAKTSDSKWIIFTIMQKEVKDKIVSLHSQTRVQTSIKNGGGPCLQLWAAEPVGDHSRVTKMDFQVAERLSTWAVTTRSDLEKLCELNELARKRLERHFKQSKMQVKVEAEYVHNKTGS